MPLPVRWMAWESIFLVSCSFHDFISMAISIWQFIQASQKVRRNSAWIASNFQGKYTTKSDVWSFAVTLWEILNLGRRVPYEHLSDEEVVQSLRQLHHAADCNNVNSEDNCKEDSRNVFDYLPRPTASSKDIYDLMLECWRREENERPTFREISLFLQRKNLGYAPTSWYWAPNLSKRDVFNNHPANQSNLGSETGRRACNDRQRHHSTKNCRKRTTSEWEQLAENKKDESMKRRQICITTSKI